MHQLRSYFARLAKGTSGAEVSELAIVLALVVAGAVATIALIGPKIAQFYAATNNQLP